MAGGALAQFCQGQNGLIGQGLAVGGLFGDSLGAAAGLPANREGLGAEEFVSNAPALHHVMVRLDLSRNQGFAQAKGGIDGGLTALTRKRVDGKKHA